MRLVAEWSMMMGEHEVHGISLTDEDVAVVLQAIREGRVRTLDGVPYDAVLWDEEAVRDWLERTHQPRRAKQIVAELHNGQRVKSRPVAPTVDIALRPLLARIAQLEQELAQLRARQSAS